MTPPLSDPEIDKGLYRESLSCMKPSPIYNHLGNMDLARVVYHWCFRHPKPIARQSSIQMTYIPMID